MYQNLSNQNPLLNKFNGYSQTNNIPFQNNNLIKNNVHVMNNLSTHIQQHRNIQQNIPMYQNNLNQHNLNQNNSRISKPSNKKNSNIIEDMLKPEKILKNDNKDVLSNFNVREKILLDTKDGKSDIKITNVPYKCILKDRVVQKKVDEIKEEDIIVHKCNKDIDADVVKFNKDLTVKKAEKKEINKELNIEFHIENYDKHKSKFEFNTSFINNVEYDENTFDENKQDYIDFYKKKQREAEEGKKLCDQILHNMIDGGIISKDEIPLENNDSPLDLNNITIPSTTSTQIPDNTLIPPTMLKSRKITIVTSKQTPKSSNNIKIITKKK